MNHFPPRLVQNATLQQGCIGIFVLVYISDGRASRSVAGVSELVIGYKHAQGPIPAGFGIYSTYNSTAFSGADGGMDGLLHSPLGYHAAALVQRAVLFCILYPYAIPTQRRPQQPTSYQAAMVGPPLLLFPVPSSMARLVEHGRGIAFCLVTVVTLCACYLVYLSCYM